MASRPDRMNSSGRKYSRIGYCEMCGKVTYCKSDPYNKPPKTCDNKECRSAIYRRTRMNQTWRQPAVMITFTCKQCGAEVTKEKSTMNKPGSGQFCNRDCKNAWQRDNPEKLWQWRGGKVTVNCIQCGKEFETWPYVVRDGHGKFCSPDCSYQWNSKNRRGENSPTWRGGEIEVPCSVCGAILKRFPYQIESCKEHVCSNSECKSKLTSMLFPAGKSHPKYKHGFINKGYDESYNESFKTRIRKLYNNTCFMCGTHQDLLPRKLDVHHVNPMEYRFPVEETCDGFVALCRSCHGKMQDEETFNYWTEYFTMLFDLYGGWYKIYEEIIK